VPLPSSLRRSRCTITSTAASDRSIADGSAADSSCSAPGAPQQDREHAGLARRELERRVVEPRHRLVAAQAQATEADRRDARGPASATQQRAHPRLELDHVEGLDEVVVGTGVEAEHAVADLVARGQQQHRQRIAPVAQTAQHVDAVATRQADVQDRGVPGAGGERGVGGVAVRDPLGREAGALEGTQHGTGDLRVVLGEQHLHRVRGTTERSRCHAGRSLKGWVAMISVRPSLDRFR